MGGVGGKIKEAKLRNGMSQKLLTKKLGVAEKLINEVGMRRRVAQEPLIDKASKILNADFNDVSAVVTDETLIEERKAVSDVRSKSSKGNIERDEVWINTFSSVLKNVPILDYSLKDNRSFRELPIYSNKAEGCFQDKVLYLEIQDDEMSGFRVLRGDLAFAALIREVSNSGIFLAEYKGRRAVRQIKNLGNSKALLVSDAGGLLTETMSLNEISVLARLDRIGIKL